MSGFLRRLATRAMGIAPMVRATASSPFSTMPSLVEESLPVEMPVAAGHSASTPVTAGRPWRPDVRGGVAPPVNGPSPGPAGDASHLGDLGDLGDLDLGRPDWRAGRRSLAPAPKSGSAATGGAREPEPSPLLPAQPETGALPLSSPEGRVAIGPATAEAEAEDAPLVSDGSVSVASGPAELLLPPVRLSVAAGWFDRERSGAERRPGGSRPATVEETTEVHVSIGRIEVTAVHEAPPPKRAAPRRPAPMSLDEYVATRQGRRL
jgi:hypothetical protein